MVEVRNRADVVDHSICSSQNDILRRCFLDWSGLRRLEPRMRSIKDAAALGSSVYLRSIDLSSPLPRLPPWKPRAKARRRRRRPRRNERRRERRRRPSRSQDAHSQQSAATSSDARVETTRYLLLFHPPFFPRRTTGLCYLVESSRSFGATQKHQDRLERLSMS